MSELHVAVEFPILHKFITTRFPVTVVPMEHFQEADILIADTFSDKLERFNGVRVLATGENHHVDLNRFDYCLTHDYREDDRCYRYPYWLMYLLLRPELRSYMMGERPLVTPDELQERQTEFCAFVCRNPKGKARNAFVRALSARRKVNCAGPFMNNVGFLLPKGYEAKREYQRKHCFSMAYENEAYPGYQTEKIVDAFLSSSIPIYWGNTRVSEEFNPAAFVHARDFRNRNELVEYVLKLADDPVRRAEMINQPLMRDMDIFTKTDHELENFFARIFERGAGAIRRTRFQRFMGEAQKFYGHGLFRTIRYTSRRLRGKN